MRSSTVGGAVEVLLFAGAGLVVLLSHSVLFQLPGLLLLGGIVSAYRMTVRGHILGCAPQVARVYRRNTLILGSVGFLGLFDPLGWPAALLLVVLAVVIGKRARDYGHPVTERGDVPRLMQLF